MEETEKSSLVEQQQQQPVAYTRRWYLVAVYASSACLQSALCVVWLVVSEASAAAFGWTNADLSAMQIWIYVTYLVGMPFFAWLMQIKGMRVNTLVAVLLIFLSTLCRIITFTQPWVTWLSHLGHMLNGIAAPGLFAGSPVISATWFPHAERATATAIITSYALSGTALIFITNTYVVPAPVLANNSITQNITNVPEIKAALMNLRYSEFGIATFLLILTFIYFPAKPPSAPSISSTVDKVEFRTAIRQIFSRQKANFWFVAIPAALSAGIFGVFGSMLSVILADVGAAQTTAGWLSVCGTIGSCISGVIIGRLGDKCIGRRKLMLIIMITSGAIGCLFFALIVGEYIPFNIVGVYISYLVLGAAVNGALPLFYETCIETTFPVSEGVTMGVITMSYNLPPIAFLAVPFIPNIGTLWMNWVMFGTLIVCLPLLLIYKERYDRLSLDTK